MIKSGFGFIMPNPFPPEFFGRIDDSDDELFYSAPRLVVHIDDGAIAKVGEIYAQLLPQGGAILDLMSSWRSHLPAHLRPSRVVGLGMNRAEMEDNPAADRDRHPQSQSRSRGLPFADAEFDGAVVTVSVQYMTRPLETFARSRARAQAGCAVRRDVLEPDVPDQGGRDLAESRRAMTTASWSAGTLWSAARLRI